MSRGWMLWMWLAVLRLAAALPAGLALAHRLTRTLNRVRWAMYLVR